MERWTVRLWLVVYRVMLRVRRVTVVSRGTMTVLHAMMVVHSLMASSVTLVSRLMLLVF